MFSHPNIFLFSGRVVVGNVVGQLYHAIWYYSPNRQENVLYTATLTSQADGKPVSRITA